MNAMIGWVLENGDEDSQAIAAAVLTRQNVPATVYLPVGSNTALLDHFSIPWEETDQSEHVSVDYLVRDEPYSLEQRADAWVYSYGRPFPKEGLILDVDEVFFPCALYDYDEMLTPLAAMEEMGVSMSESAIGTTSEGYPGLLIPGWPAQRYLRAFTILRDAPKRGLAAQAAVGGVHASWGRTEGERVRLRSARSALPNRARDVAIELELDLHRKLG